MGKRAKTPSTFMSASCFIRSISKVSCCLVLSTSSWVCWVTDSIFTVSALCQHINTLDVTTHSQMLTSNLKPTPLDWSAYTFRSSSAWLPTSSVCFSFSLLYRCSVACALSAQTRPRRKIFFTFFFFYIFVHDTSLSVREY